MNKELEHILKLALLINRLIKNFEVLYDTTEITPNNIEGFQSVADGLQELNESCKPV